MVYHLDRVTSPCGNVFVYADRGLHPRTPAGDILWAVLTADCVGSRIPPDTDLIAMLGFATTAGASEAQPLGVSSIAC